MAISILLLLLGFILYLTNFGQYLYIKNSISKLEADRKPLALTEFYSRYKPDNFHSGTIAFVNKMSGGGVFLWTNGIIKYYRTSKDTAFSFYSICKIYKDTENDRGAFSIDDSSRTVTNDISAWSRLVKAGNFTQVVFAKDNKEVAREVITYDVPLFIDFNIKKLCPN